MIALKQGVRLAGMRTEVLFAMSVVEHVFSNSGRDTVITSVTDGKHSRGSLHYVGLAFDVRLRGLPRQHCEKLATITRAALTEEFDVVVEWGDGNAPHMHVEYQPKSPTKGAT